MSLATSLNNVALLSQHVLVDNQPAIQPRPISVQLNASLDTAFGDADLYSNLQSHLAGEARFMRKMYANVDEAMRYFGIIYATRSLSKALPQVKTQDQPDRVAIYEKTHDILRPEVEKMKEFMRFANRACAELVEVIKYLAAIYNKNKEPIVSEPLLLSIVHLLNGFSLLDNMKNMKTAWNNDFAMYKRACTNLKRMDEGETMENQHLYLFLANHDCISTKLRTDVVGIDGYVEVLTSVVNVCVDYYEEDQFALPDEKYALLRAMAFSLSMIDGNDEKTSILRNKRVKLDRALKILRSWPIIPLIGDMQMDPSAYMKHAPHIERSKLQPETEDEILKLQTKYRIITSLDGEIVRFKDYMSRFAIFSNQVRAQENWEPAPDFDLLALVFEGIKLLSSWTTQIHDQAAWKYAHPVDKFSNRNCPETAGEYEKLVKYNYSLEERFALVEMISMIKSVATALQTVSATIAPLIRRCIHRELFTFVQNTLLDITSHSIKKKRPSQSVLVMIRDMLMDAKAVIELPDEDDKKKKKGPAGPSTPVTYRACAPSSTQLNYARVLLESLYNEKAAGMKGTLMKGKDYSSQQIFEMMTFYKRSFLYPYLLDLDKSVLACSDLSVLWFKEFYLEVTRSVQFPIEQSLPWILTDSIIESPSGTATEYMLVPLDLYNDSANSALWALKSRYLYDEIEAEVNLCFDELVFKVSEAVFTHYKTQASCILLDKALKHVLVANHVVRHLDVPTHRFTSLLRQKHVQLLGRTIDFSQLMAQRMNRLLRSSIEMAIGRFEAHEFGTGIMELEGLLDNARLTHNLLSEFLPLDPFEDMLREVDDAVDLTLNNGRIFSHVVMQLIYDFLPNYSFSSGTQQFVRAPIELSQTQVERDAMPKIKHSLLFGNKFVYQAMSNVYEPFKESIGLQQIATIIRVIGQDKIGVLIDELLKNVEVQLVNMVCPYVESFMRGIPVDMKTPLFQYGTLGTFQYFQAHLKPILAYRDLKTEVFHVFRELGNSLIFARLLDQSMLQRDLFTYVQSLPFYTIDRSGVTVPSTTGQVDPTAFFKFVTTHLQGQPFSESLGGRAEQASKLNAPSLARKSLFVRVLERFDALLAPVREKWRGSRPTNGILNIDETSEFYRLWSVLQFAYCTPGAKTEFSTQTLFGEGLPWTGCAIIYLLGQRVRFQVMDICYHIVNVHAVDGQVGNIGSMNIVDFIQEVKNYQRLNDSIFATLQTLLPDRDLHGNRYGVAHPPLDTKKVPTYESYDGEHGTAVSRKIEKIEAGSGVEGHDTRV
ncbi:cytoplasmic FMR1-interacting protein 1 [Capsaspora owczarzaki ATCC 30864]|uniref:Cytoplasmic FMR1-interacting protein 1 n=1 Tax=Capsaspora owczarzaki (strain ATCC 30864) TaxID=595528 RepID=A0A0D2WGK4_CAPO3|nr:cytoplasmic FMR1-interacting protein 1 [Capsaspora owczarzaki ATCC 30864]KJE88550.1 cytoplasmic FMR1-interacting protein 1 [Capsaspora owczarzaki ATCC 30864]|eukprot:XP_004365062.1 cytoplasmic FMR1-interacting protein 1 [Capsaspora owczarzaki ATCC 30864]